MPERILRIINIRLAENFQVSEAQSLGHLLGHLGVPSGEYGQLNIFKLKI